MSYACYPLLRWEPVPGHPEWQRPVFSPNPFSVRIITNNSGLSDAELATLVNAEVAKGVEAFNSFVKHNRETSNEFHANCSTSTT